MLHLSTPWKIYDTVDLDATTAKVDPPLRYTQESVTLSSD